MTSLLLAFAASVVQATSNTAGADHLPRIAFEKYTLPNGLDVILHEDHSTPIVGVNLWYHVGSKNEQPGRTGFAHLFEHMMFQGSKHYDRDYFLPLQQAGGRINGSTSSDRTNYWETVPSNFLELALWMESDRMAFLLPSMTQERLDNQRSVVKNERRQSYENRPYGLAYETILAAMYPPDHPYSWPTIGSMADLDNASREDVANFFRRYYHPGNASLCIAGDFEPVEAKRLVAKYFAPISAGPKVEKLKPPAAKLDQAKRLRLTDRAGLARLFMNWLTVPLFAPDDAELDALADVLAGDKTSRLYRRLVRDQQIAQDVSASQRSGEIGGAFNITVTARPGKELGELERLVVEEIERLQQEPPTAAEIARAVARRESELVSSLESVSGFGGRADQLNRYNVLAGDPGQLTDDVLRLRRVTPAAVSRTAKQYLSQPRVTLEVLPGQETKITPDPRQPAAAARQELAKKVVVPQVPAGPAVPENADRVNLPKPRPEPDFHLPKPQRARLANGMHVLLMENHELPAVSIHTLFPCGRADDPADKLGLAQLTAAVWDEGTSSRTSEQIAEQLANIGAELSLSADHDQTAARLYTLTRHLDAALDVLGDVLQHPTFPADELERQRNIALGRLMQVRNEPMALAGLATAQSLYGYGHPYGRPPMGTASSLRGIQRADLEQFYRTRIAPAQSTIVVVGDATLADIQPRLEKAVGGWRNTAADAARPWPKAAVKTAPQLVLVDKPGAVQSVLSAALLGFERQSPDYAPLTVLNTALGGQFASRLNLNLREKKGYTYGARSSYDWRPRDTGVFAATTSVQTEVTVPALQELLKEMSEIAGPRPVQGEELDFCKKYFTRGFPANFETSSSLAAQLGTVVQFRLPDDYFNGVVPKVAAVESSAVVRVAQQYLNSSGLTIVVVGDRTKIETALRELPAGKNLAVVRFDDDFRLQPLK
jgi:zinc protease